MSAQSLARGIAASAETFPPLLSIPSRRSSGAGRLSRGRAFHLNNFMREYVSSLRARRGRQRLRLDCSFDIHLVHGGRAILLGGHLGARNSALPRVERNRWKTSDLAFVFDSFFVFSLLFFFYTPTDLEELLLQGLHAERSESSSSEIMCARSAFRE